ncbi:MAG: hypothetical protein ACI92G_002651, partial [Candidatus Pelagisphaera sp.]
LVRFCYRHLLPEIVRSLIQSRSHYFPDWSGNFIVRVAKLLDPAEHIRINLSHIKLNSLQSIRTYRLVETPICLAEATSEERALFEMVFLTSLSAFASSFLRQEIGVRFRLHVVAPRQAADNRFETESYPSISIL